MERGKDSCESLAEHGYARHTDSVRQREHPRSRKLQTSDLRGRKGGSIFHKAKPIAKKAPAIMIQENTLKVCSENLLRSLVKRKNKPKTKTI